MPVQGPSGSNVRTDWKWCLLEVGEMDELKFKDITWAIQLPWKVYIWYYQTKTVLSDNVWLQLLHMQSQARWSMNQEDYCTSPSHNLIYAFLLWLQGGVNRVEGKKYIKVQLAFFLLFSINITLPLVWIFKRGGRHDSLTNSIWKLTVLLTGRCVLSHVHILSTDAILTVSLGNAQAAGY